MKCGTYRSPLNTSYAWEISHALATLYHPYAQSPSALTEYLKRKLQVQCAKRRSRSHPAQVEQNVPLERNILDPGSGCASPLSIDGVAFGFGTWSTSRFSTVQVGQTALDRYTKYRSSCGSKIDIAQERVKRSYHRQANRKIISYTGDARDRIVHGLRCGGVRKETMQSDVSAYE